MSNPEPAAPEQTTVGNYFIANYPPFSFWRADQTHLVPKQLASEPPPDVPFGLYVHIPFCRKRCDFCYFRVYTDKDSHAVRRYLDAVIREVASFATEPYVRGRLPQFVYFGGGTPSYLSVEQLDYLFTGLQHHIPWQNPNGRVREVTFECEPGTLQPKKIAWLREAGVTRLSLGVENFNPDILELNNRAHRAKEIHTAYEYARSIGFPQINIDLIAGMLGETDENWADCITKTRELAPDSVTIYQMEIPYNTTVYRRMKDRGTRVAPVADWDTKRRWLDAAFRDLERDGYHVGSAHTAAKANVEFLYRDGLWCGADLLGVGVASFSHLGGLHFQNKHDFDPYIAAVEGGALPVHRALRISDDERLVREFVLQLKFGALDLQGFRDKFGVDPLERFAEPLAKHAQTGMLKMSHDRIELTRQGLLQADSLLPEFFREEHRAARYA